MGTAKRETDPWKVDLARFRVYLEKKYNVEKAFYFLGFLDESQQSLYEFLITEAKLGKILFPDRQRASSLYKKLGAPCFAALDDKDTKRKIEMKKAP